MNVVSDMMDEIEALKAENERLRAALKNLADDCRHKFGCGAMRALKDNQQQGETK